MCRTPPHLPEPITRPCCSASRRSVTPSKICASSWRRWRATAWKPSARWAPTRRWRCCRTSRSSLYNYFKQLFAQVTNPPIDCIREEIVTSAETTIGSERNLLKPEPESCRLIELKSPILTNEELAKLKHINQPGFQIRHAADSVQSGRRRSGLEKAHGRTCAQQASQAIEDGVNILILSDRGIDQENAPIPALLAVAGLHHHLIREGTRTQVGLVLESGEPREVHHFSLLIGYGCGAINPYLAFETLDDMIRQGLLQDIDHKDSVQEFRQSGRQRRGEGHLEDGHLDDPELSRRADFRSDRPEQAVVDKYFTWTPSRIEGVGLDVIAEEVLMRHQPRVPGSPGQRPHARRRRPVSMARGRRVSSVQPADGSQAAARRAAPAITRRSRNTRRW